MPDLITATNNFHSSGVVGDGGFGLVYKGHLPDGRLVAVKKLGIDCFQVRAGPLNRINRVLSSPSLTSLVLNNLWAEYNRLLTRYCDTGPDRVLIYEYAENGSLDQWLHTEPSDSFTSSARLTWPIRVNIIKGVAAGLEYLHDTVRPRIIHRDIKASNVLLDEQFQAHIADFGLARRINPSYSHVSTQVAGTMGYIPPEYKDGWRATVKGDVYSFGVLMIEVATGRRPNLAVEEVVVDGKVKLVFLVNWAKQLVQEGREMDAIEQVLREDSPEAGVKEYFRIASMCTNDDHRERPLMAEVVSMLQNL
ncbi:Phytosulfokine receptor 2 [Nymphaea thermarum]|nr:Phytosulfokine receptor 2 [Nymphaea thermarum]